jgi:hypothetical protein
MDAEETLLDGDFIDKLSGDRYQVTRVRAPVPSRKLLNGRRVSRKLGKPFYVAEPGGHRVQDVASDELHFTSIGGHLDLHHESYAQT